MLTKQDKVDRLNKILNELEYFLNLGALAPLKNLLTTYDAFYLTTEEAVAILAITKPLKKELDFYRVMIYNQAVRVLELQGYSDNFIQSTLLHLE